MELEEKFVSGSWTPEFLESAAVEVPTSDTAVLKESTNATRTVEPPAKKARQGKVI